ncbi:GAF domain-containing protein [Usitatibacter palustris]|uniref:GAF domain-containing protein n=1 Tax=Usitatibacter palustris TaxID=2732487 RepID=A0A6M4H6P1_9PROT|nr:GAF domain-containing protein [Usitatibacter palustris]QJR14855.1 hypothetical protein DSM104440_01670 [Usitatibacter palustris]
MTTLPANDDAVVKLRQVYASDGVRAAVVFLNSTTVHRFTSLYRFDGGTLRNITFYDRQNPHAEKCDDIPVEASYCVFVRDLHSAFLVSDAPEDDRVEGHANRATVKRYCGVPLRDRDGKMFGSICHFDLSPGPISDRDVELLEHMASLLRPTF